MVSPQSVPLFPRRTGPHGRRRGPRRIQGPDCGSTNAQPAACGLGRVETLRGETGKDPAAASRADRRMSTSGGRYFGITYIVQVEAFRKVPDVSLIPVL